ncbi:alpha/beta hydrolase [Bacillus cereus]|nr:alpha/beta hydrolase [Bacillus cereus]
MKQQKPKGVWKKRMFISLLIVFGLVLAGVSYWNFSPVPKAYMYGKALTKVTNSESANYENSLKKVEIVKDIDYNSKFPDGTLDIIFPKNHTEETPVIFWTHGGGFIAGDKSGLTGYAVELAARGYTVVNINYALAPKYKYPTPIKQLSEAYEYIKENEKKYKLKLNNVYFAGDSAGANITANFVNIQTSPKYAKLTGIDAVVEPSTIKGALLYCGPYDFVELANKKESEMYDFVRTVGWSYFGKKEFGELSETKYASVLNYVTKDFPATFITDGNTGSFEAQNKALASNLHSKGVAVDSLFYDKNVSGELGHEYQLIIDSPKGQETFKKTLEFLSKNK